MSTPGQRVLWLARIAVALGLVAFLLARSGVMRGDAFAGLVWWPVALGALVMPVSVGIRAYNLTLLTNVRTRILGPAEAMRLTLVGAGLSLVLPAGAADAAKAHYGYRTHGHAEEMIVSAALDKLTSLTALCLLAAAGGLVTGDAVTAGVATLACIATTVPFWAPRLVPWRLALRVLAPGHEADDAVIAAVSRPPVVRLALVYAVSIVGWFVTYAVLYLASRAVGAQVEAVHLFAIAPLTSLARMVPISAGGVGLGEVTYAGLLAAAGVPTDVASQAALVALALVVLAPGAVGLLLLAAGRYQRTSATSHGNGEDSSTDS